MAKKKIGYDGLFCVICGEGVEKHALSCPRCGRPYDDSKFLGVEQLGAGGVGWSSHAEDPCFRQQNKKNVKGMIVIMMIVSLFIFAAIYFSGDMEFSEVLPIFGIVMAIEWAFWLLWLILQYGKRKDWEGVVEGKEHTTRQYTRKDNNGHRETYTSEVYTVLFRTNDGKRKKLIRTDLRSWYDYLHEGDPVRYHGKYMDYYEKYDKSRDRFIPCASCGSLRDARETYCGRCGCILLKAPTPAPPRQSSAGSPNGVRFCPNCGASVAGGRFCTSCGGQLHS